MHFCRQFSWIFVLCVSFAPSGAHAQLRAAVGSRIESLATERADALAPPGNIPTEDVDLSVGPAYRILNTGIVAARDERGALLGDWTVIDDGGIAATPCAATLAFDAAEVNATTGVGVGGNCITGGAALTRFLLRVGDTGIPKCFRIIEDLNVAAEFADSRANFIEVWVNWTPPTAEPIVIIVNTFEQFNGSCSIPPDPASGFLGSIVFESTSSLASGLYLIQIDMCSSPGLWLRMPVDGSGAYEVILGNAYDSSTTPPTFSPPTSATFARWGTEAGRPGSQTSQAWIDYSPPDGQFSASECSVLTPLPAIAANCGITDVSVGVAFWANNACFGIKRGDANCDGRITNFDISPFVAALAGTRADYLATGASSACYDQRTCWGDLDRHGDFNNFDIDPFVSCLTVFPPIGSPCP